MGFQNIMAKEKKKKMYEILGLVPISSSSFIKRPRRKDVCPRDDAAGGWEQTDDLQQYGQSIQQLNRKYLDKRTARHPHESWTTTACGIFQTGICAKRAQLMLCVGGRRNENRVEFKLFWGLNGSRRTKGFESPSDEGENQRTERQDTRWFLLSTN